MRQWGMGTGWVGGGVIPGPTDQLLEERYPDSEAGPVASCREAEWVVGVARTPGDHPAGPVGTTRGPSLSPPRECRLWANKARFKVLLLELSQNRGVSPEYVEKACRSPYFQNTVQKSALDFLGFPYFPAFSHKELIGLF